MCIFLCSPLDFIGNLSNRWSYGFAFGAIAPSVIQLFSESYTPFNVPNWAKGSLIITMQIFYICYTLPFKGLKEMDALN